MMYVDASKVQVVWRGYADKMNAKIVIAWRWRKVISAEVNARKQDKE